MALTGENVEIVVIGGGGSGLNSLISQQLEKLDQVMIIDRPKEITFEIKVPKNLTFEPLGAIQIQQNKEHGWYRQFEKNNKRKNFARK